MSPSINSRSSFLIRFFIFSHLLTSIQILLPVRPTYAQITTSVSATVAPCDDFATRELKNAWDMLDSADVNNFTPNDIVSINNISIGNSLFSGTSMLTAGGHFYLLSPQVASTQPIGGRWGQNNPIDVSKYRNLTVRMSVSEFDPSGGLRILFNRAKNYSDARTFTRGVPTRPGWRSYSIDLNAVAIDSGSANTQPWSAGSITGLGVYPSVVPQPFQVDFIRLEDPSTCGSAVGQFTASRTGNDDFYNIYIDDNNSPFDGFFTKLSTAVAATNGTVSLSSLGLAPGTYKLTGILHSDYATLENDDPWNMDASSDVSLFGAVNNAVVSGGSFNGTSSSGSPTVYMRIPAGGTISTSKYSKLSIKVTKAVKDAMNVFWTGGGVTLFPGTADPDNDDVWTFDLSSETSWTGNINEFIIQPTVTSGNSFSIDFVALRSSGFVTTDTLPTAAVSTGSFVVANPPIIDIKQPDNKGGEAIRPWNFLPGDLDFSINVSNVADTSNPSELLTTYLPDVRLVGGRRGDFFKGTNKAGNDDPNDFLLFPFTPENQFTFNGDEYHNMCLTMMVDREYDLALGSVSKLFYQKVGGAVEEFDAWVTIYDRWSGDRWYEYCSDLTTHPREDAQITWGGTIDLFRIDPHEFHLDSCCDNTGNPIGNPISATYYYDSLKLRKDDTSNGRFTIVYDVKDTDTPAPSITFLYNSVKSVNGATPIGSDQLSCEGFVCIWDTRTIPTGRYHLIGTASDGTSGTTSLSSGKLHIANDTSVAPLQPRLEVESPTNGQPVCSSIQFKGFALVENRFEDISAVQVFVDGVFFAKLSPHQYSPRAVAAFPSADASNTGFNELQSATSISAGNHTVRIVAYASDGSTTSQQVSITRNPACSDPNPIADPTSAGSPVVSRVLDGDGGGASPTPTTPPGGSTPTPGGATLSLAGTHSGRGVLNLTVSPVTSKAKRCTAALSASLPSASPTLIKSINFAPSKTKRSRLQMQVRSLLVAKAKIPALQFSVATTCGGITESSNSRQVTMKTKKGVGTQAAAFASLRKGLKVVVPRR